MKKTVTKIFAMVVVLTLMFGFGMTSALAATVSSWSSIFFSKITTTGNDINGDEDEIAETLNESVVNPSTTNLHYKDDVEIKVTTGSNSNFTVSIDGVTLTSSNMTSTYTSHWQSTFALYYYKWTLTITQQHCGS
jgi:hypothetical protein